MKNTRNLLLTAAALIAALVPAAASAQSGYYAASYASSQQAAHAQQQQAWAAYQQQQAAYAAYQQQQAAYAAYQQQQAAYAAYQQQQAAYAAAQQQQAAQAQQVSMARRAAPAAAGNSMIRFDGRFAACSASLPTQVQYVINAANYLQSSPYVRGAGHGRVEDGAYDCSSSTSYTLIKAGLLRSPLTSQGFANYGEAGEGRFITIWVKPGEHVFMTICGLRLDTSGGAQGEGPRWRTKGRSFAGFMPRHPAGL